MLSPVSDECRDPRACRLRMLDDADLCAAALMRALAVGDASAPVVELILVVLLGMLLCWARNLERLDRRMSLFEV